MKKLIILFLVCNLFPAFGQKHYYITLEDNLLTVKNGMSMELFNDISNDINIELPNSNSRYTIKVLGNRKYLGVEKIEDFKKNKKAILAKYSDIRLEYGWADSYVSYEVNDDLVFGNSSVKFYITYGGFSSTPPSGKHSLEDGVYIVEFWAEMKFIHSFYLLKEKNKLREFPIDYKLD